MRKLLLAFFTCVILTNAVPGQAPQSWSSADMYLAIRKLNVLGSVLYIAAHPDDENTRLITYLSKDRLFRTGYLSLTRGDGGQNLIGNEQGIELGLIRTQELLSARRVDGGEQFFTRAYDFGYSKTADETFTKWDREKILSDVVWVIRRFQPDVVINRFPTTGEGGHGHHTASGILANEAFSAAADPSKFPEQLKYVKVWQVKRVLWNVFNFGNTAAATDIFQVDVGGYNPLLGKSYGEIAAQSRSNHKSQGFGSGSSRGEFFENFRATKGDLPAKDLLDGVDISWNRVTGGAAVTAAINDIANAFDLLRPEKSVPQLVRLYSLVNSLPDHYWKTQKLAEIYQLIAQCSGLFLDVTTPEQYAVQTDSFRVSFSFNNRLGADAVLQRVTLDGFDSAIVKSLEKNRNVNFQKTIYVSADKAITQPYWLAAKMSEGYFNVSDQLAIGNADVDPSFIAVVEVKIAGELFKFNRPVRFKFTDPVRGELYQPLVVVPPLLISPDEKYKISTGSNNFKGELNLTSKKKGFTATLKGVRTEQADKVKVDYSPSAYTFEDRNKTIQVSYSVDAGRNNEYIFGVPAGDGRTDMLLSGMNEIKYDHIPYINYFSAATVINRNIDLKTYGKKVAYIIGAGDKVPEALEQMGYDVAILTDKELSRNKLNEFDAIITGVRAYNTNEWMNKYYDKLMKYVHEGGNLIVQYNTSSNIGPVKAKISPYALDISRTRITDENAAVTFLKPDHQVLNFPNKIGSGDFQGWVQERSIYHAANWDNEKFEAILSMKDPGEKNEDGSLVIAKHGKGYFTYTGLVFFRELPAGVPGAYRLLANLIALNQKKSF